VHYDLLIIVITQSARRKLIKQFAKQADMLAIYYATKYVLVSIVVWERRTRQTADDCAVVSISVAGSTLPPPATHRDICSYDIACGSQH